MKTDIEKIDAFLRNEMNGSERSEFLVELESNKELASQYNESKVIYDGLRYNKLKEIKSTLFEFENEFSNSSNNIKANKNSKMIPMTRWVKIASAACIFMIAGYFGFQAIQTEPQNQYATIFQDENFDNYIHHSLQRSTTENTNYTSDQVQAYNLFTMQEFDKAIPMCKALWENEQDTLAYYYLGISYLGVGKTKSALEIFNSEITDKYSNPVNK